MLSAPTLVQKRYFSVLWERDGEACSLSSLICCGRSCLVQLSPTVNIFLAILFGSMSLALIAPEMQGEHFRIYFLKLDSDYYETISLARGAAAKLWETIDPVPPIDSQSSEGLSRMSTSTIPHSQTCTLIGTSGSVKSTIISLIERFYDLLAGSVKLDGIDLCELNVK